MTADRLTNTRIGVLGKGGSGKSTITVLLARALQNRGYGASRGSEEYLTRKLEEKGLKAIGVVHDDTSISLSWMEGRPLGAHRDMAEAVKRLTRWEAS